MALKILLAEGNVAAQNAARKILASGGHDVVAVSQGLAALKKISEVHPDIALLDIHLAGCSGVEVCKKVKATPELAQIPVVLTAGQLEPFGAAEANRIKADGLITKPFDVASLIPMVERLAAGLQPEECAGTTQAKSSEKTLTKVRPGSAENGEVCDVCGRVNRADSLVCENCDVPLPSSVKRQSTAG